MNDDLAKLVDADRLEITRTLPAPRERVWEFIVDPELRSRWFCAGIMGTKAGEKFVMEFDHSRLSDALPPDAVGRDCKEAVSMSGTIRLFDPPAKLVYIWHGQSEEDQSLVTIELEDLGESTRLHLAHSRLVTPKYRVEAAAGWHAHFDLLTGVLSGEETKEFWENYLQLRAEYENQLLPS